MCSHVCVFYLMVRLLVLLNLLIGSFSSVLLFLFVGIQLLFDCLIVYTFINIVLAPSTFLSLLLVTKLCEPLARYSVWLQINRKMVNTICDKIIRVLIPEPATWLMHGIPFGCKSMGKW